MVKLSEFIGEIVSDISEARKIADSNSVALSQSYHADPFLRRIPVPQNVSFWGMHQYSWKGKVNGISGDVDMDNCIFNYPEFIKENGFNGYSASMP